MTIVRIGPIQKINKPANELTSAYVGKIARLPLDTAANASFLPDNLLNLDSLVLIAGMNELVWMSAVDLKKAHHAFKWN